MLSDTTDYNTRTKEQLIELVNVLQRDKRNLEKENRKLKEQVDKWNKDFVEWRIVEKE